MGQPFQIVSVKKSKPPSGAEGTDWHCYIIAQGGNEITGYRQGSLRSVTRAAKEITAQLNERRTGKRGRVHLAPAPKKRG
jgi:hypothetical protein